MRCTDVAIVSYRADHAAAFRDLNLAWIRKHFTVEAHDRDHLDDPGNQIIAPGGQIFIAELDGVPVGTCALVRKRDGVYELAKMTVAESARGLGIGRLLGEATLAHARAVGATEVELFSNSSLLPALTLYRSLGFRDVPVGMVDYQRTDVRMVWDPRSS